MTPEIERRLMEFESRHKPDSRHHLDLFREEVVYLHFKGYSLKATFVYLQEQGVGCSQRTFERWVKDCIDFDKEPRPEAATRLRPWPAEAAAEAGEGGAQAKDDDQSPKGRVGQLARRPLITDDGANFSLAGAPADSPDLRPADVVARGLPKPPVLVDELGGNDLHSDPASKIGSSGIDRQEALAKARALRERGFESPVERAVGGQDRSK